MREGKKKYKRLTGGREGGGGKKERSCCWRNYNIETPDARGEDEEFYKRAAATGWRRRKRKENRGWGCMKQTDEEAEAQRESVRYKRRWPARNLSWALPPSLSLSALSSFLICYFFFLHLSLSPPSSFLSTSPPGYSVSFRGMVSQSVSQHQLDKTSNAIIQHNDKNTNHLFKSAIALARTRNKQLNRAPCSDTQQQQR